MNDRHFAAVHRNYFSLSHLNIRFYFANFRSKVLPLLILSLLFCSKSIAQSGPIHSFFHLSCPEKWWVIGHPFIAKKAFKITEEARGLSDSLKNVHALDGDANGGRIDAFRHAYWMARLAQTFNWKKALKLGRAHEKANYKMFKKHRFDEEGSLPDSVSSAMDLVNNQIGVAIGCNNRSLPATELKEIIVEAIFAGQMKIIAKDEKGNPLDCNGLPIDVKLYLRRWNIPKCLINSSH